MDLFLLFFWFKSRDDNFFLMDLFFFLSDSCQLRVNFLWGLVNFVSTFFGDSSTSYRLSSTSYRLFVSTFVNFVSTFRIDFRQLRIDFRQLCIDFRQLCIDFLWGLDNFVSTFFGWLVNFVSTFFGDLTTSCDFLWVTRQLRVDFLGDYVQFFRLPFGYFEDYLLGLSGPWNYSKTR